MTVFSHVDTHRLERYRCLVEQALKVQHPEWSDEQVNIGAKYALQRFVREAGMMHNRAAPFGTMAAHERNEEREHRRAARTARSAARRARWKRWLYERLFGEEPAPAFTLELLRELAQARGAAELLYDNRLGWDADRHPYAPRAFWAALGLALGKDISWVTQTAYDDDDSRLTLQAAHQLFGEIESRVKSEVDA